MIIEDYMPKVGDNGTQELLLSCLKSNPKTLPSVFFYDHHGSELYEEITRLDEYYPPKIEIPLLRSTARKLKSELKDCDIVELGSGDCSKISVLLDEVPEKIRRTIVYYPVDVSKNAIEKSACNLQEKYPEMGIHGITADFLKHIEKIPGDRKRFFCFFGSTIGNLSEEKAIEFMGNLGKEMNENDRLLLGMDMVKDIDVLEKAYNDSKGVTAEFNKNILIVTNNHLGTNFNPDDFEHVAFFNKEYSRIEMHLRAKKDLEVSSPLLNEAIRVKKGETIHTENSHKYTVEGIRKMADAAGLSVAQIFSDDKRWFSLVEMVKK
ncbi:L-histidine N-alpha-methyltransferase [Methanohalophilus levihalophilus]|uniref:L-histidine N(alpha)-methyltransferase n=1 Tax=Methanohalophilus levihalophilus TaxID=1431282 RepID=UPI001AE6922B|nr:L-histidine N(alpha)-methyltransferase [Methanohalophilus levihalophilus]MBP2030690.1 L-histidine N-alpha-methyltransferase [Methanohalophilus levihalophilus]